MAYKMKDGKGPNALPLLALIPAAAVAAGKAILGAGTIAGAAKAGIAAGTAAAAAKTAAGAAGAIAGKLGAGGKIVAGAAKAVKGVKGAVEGVKGIVEGTKLAKGVKGAVESTKLAKGVKGAVEGSKVVESVKATKAGGFLTELGKKEVLGSTVKEHATSALKNKIMQAPAKAQQEIEERQDLKQQEQSLFKSKFSPSMMGDKKGPNMEKSRKTIAQDYARNAIVDGNTKEGRYEKKMAVKEAAGEAPSMMGHNPISKHMGGQGASMYGGPMMKGGENVIVRDAKSGGKKQYNKRGK